MDSGRVNCSILFEEGAMNVPCADSEVGVVHQKWLKWLMWVMDDEEGSKRKTKEVFMF